MKKILLVSIMLLQSNIVFASDNSHMHMSENQVMEHSQKHLKGVPNEIKNYFKGSDVDLVHRFLTQNQMKDIEKYSGVKPENYFHTFIAISDKNGKKSQLGAGTLVKVKDKKDIEIGLIYDNKLNIKDIIPIKNSNDLKIFLNQFKGKNHDSKFTIGKDLKYSGKETKLVQKIAKAIQVDSLTVQELWGKAHSH